MELSLSPRLALSSVKAAHRASSSASLAFKRHTSRNTTSEPATPLHGHEREDEAFYVLQGGLSVRMGDEEFEAPAGSFTFQPRGIPHTFSSSSASARVLLLVVPSGLEGYLRSLSRPAEAMTLPPAGPPSPEQMAQVEAALAEHSVTFVHEG